MVDTHPPSLPPHTNNGSPVPARCLPCIPPPKPVTWGCPSVPYRNQPWPQGSPGDAGAGRGGAGARIFPINTHWCQALASDPRHCAASTLLTECPPLRVPLSRRTWGSVGKGGSVCFTLDPGTRQQNGRKALKSPGQAAAAVREG